MRGVPAVLSHYAGQLDDCAYLLPTILVRPPALGREVTVSARRANGWLRFELAAVRTLWDWDGGLSVL